MATLFKLPLLGQTMQEGTILRWFKQEGEPIEGWEPLLEVMTDKVNMEVEPAVSGVVRKLLAGEGETVAVGAPIAIIAGAEEPIEALLQEADGAAAPITSDSSDMSDMSDRSDAGNGRAATVATPAPAIA